MEFWANEYTGVSLEIENNGLYKFKNNSSAFEAFNQKFYLSIAGQRDPSNDITYQNIRALFWSSSPNNSTDAFRLY